MKQEVKTKRFKMTEERYERIYNALKQGISGAEIAADEGCSVATVGKVRKDLMAEGYNLWHTNEYYYDKYPLR